MPLAPGLTNSFAFGSAAPASRQVFGTNVPTTNFAALWTGMLDLPTTGPTTFTSTSGGAMKVYIDNVLVVNKDGSPGA